MAPLSIPKTLLAVLAASSVGAVPTVSNPRTPSRRDSSVRNPVTPLDPKLVPGIVEDMLTAPTNPDRFRALLEKDGKPLEGEELRQRIIFDFEQPNRK